MGAVCAASPPSGDSKQAAADGEDLAELPKFDVALPTSGADTSTATPSVSSSQTNGAPSPGAAGSSEPLWLQQVRAEEREAEVAAAAAQPQAEMSGQTSGKQDDSRQSSKGSRGRRSSSQAGDSPPHAEAAAKLAAAEAAPKEKKADGKSSKAGSTKKKEGVAAGSAPKAKAKVKAKAKGKAKAKAGPDTAEAPEVPAPVQLSAEEKAELAAKRTALWKAMTKDGRQQVSDKLISSAGAGNLATVEELLAQGAKVNSSDIDGRSAWRSAAKSGHIPVLQALFNTGVLDVNTSNKFNGQTALHYAAMRNNKDTIHFLVLEAGVDRTLQSSCGKTAADMLQDEALKEWLSAKELLPVSAA